MSSTSKKSKSNRSVSSIGIGASTPTKLTASVPRPVPEGVTVANDSVFDSIVYLIYCSAHEKVAISNVDKCGCVCLPFVLLNNALTWQQASDEGVYLCLNSNIENNAVSVKCVPPSFKSTFLQILRVELPCRKFVIRLTCFINLRANGFVCCADNDRVHWLPVSQVLNDQVNKLWGPELMIFISMLMSTNPRFYEEFTLGQAQFHLNQQGSCEQKVLKAAKIDPHHLSEIYTDYIEHCYPSIYMCLESFVAYLAKYGNAPDKTHLTRLYYAFGFKRRSFLDIHEFVIGIAVIEPMCSSRLESRSTFIFRYYDLEHKGFLNSQSLTVLLKDANPSWTDSVVNNELNRLLQSAKVKSATNISYEDFLRMFHSQLDNKLNLLCRSPKSIFNQISPALATRAKERDKAIAMTEQVLKSKRTTKGTCWSCRVQQYEYGNHLVTIDTIGRCVESTIINNKALMDSSTQKNANASMARSRYSLEYVFSAGSVPNIFIDLIRGFYRRKSDQVGLMTVPDECTTFIKYLRILLNELLGLLANECKLVKLNAPAIVVGDLLGNLNDLMQLECHFFASFPVIPENLIFLGNYSGERGNSIECLIYLFALKLCSPNKVVLLRGANEMAHRTSEILKKEAIAKYGQANGTIIYNLMQDVFSRLPIASVIEDSLLCTHSGIPSAAPLSALFKFQKDMKNLERDEPIAVECIIRRPKESKEQTDNINKKTHDNYAKKSCTSTSKTVKMTNNGKKVLKSAPHKSKNNKSSSAKKSARKSTIIKLSGKKVMFLNTLKVRKARNVLSKPIKTANVGKSAKLALTHETYGQAELSHFLTTNEMQCLIRSHSPCAQGFNVEFNDQCMTIFSCSNCDGKQNYGAVALINGTNSSIRFVRYNFSCITTQK